jgi:hypothetical protein
MENTQLTTTAPKAEMRTSSNIIGGLLPANFEQLYRMSQIMAASGMMPKGFERPESVFVAVQMGLEVGLSPMAAVQNIAVVNGRPSLWGDAVLAIVRASGLLENFSETIEGSDLQMKAVCRAKRRGQAELIVREFSVEDAKKANLWGKAGTWAQYPKRMLQMRARSWALRDGFSDMLKGFRVAEEAADIVELEQNGNGNYVPQEQKPEPEEPKKNGKGVAALKTKIKAEAATSAPEVKIEPIIVKDDLKSCPELEGRDVTVESCEKCQHRKGCPSW